MSGVKGLAAMFEKRGDDAPSDDRGRSPGPIRSIGGMYESLVYTVANTTANTTAVYLFTAH